MSTTVDDQRTHATLGRLIRVLKADDHQEYYDRLSRRIQKILMDAQEEIVAETMGGDFNPGDQQDLNRLDHALTEEFSDRVIDSAGDAIQQAYVAGTDGTLAGEKWYLNRTDRDAIAWLREDFTYWVGGHWGDEISTTIRGALDVGVAAGEKRSKLAGRLRSALGAQFAKSEDYWQGLANHVVTRSRSFGVVEGMVRAGAVYYQILAVRDARTSDFCKSMHGRVFTVKSAVAVRDQLMAAKDPDQVKAITPWLKSDSQQGKQTSAIPKSQRIPPFHWLCRTTLALWTDEGMPKGMNRNDWSAARELVDPSGLPAQSVKDVQVALAKHFDGGLRQVLDRTGPGGLSFSKSLSANGETRFGRVLLDKPVDVYVGPNRMLKAQVSVFGDGARSVQILNDGNLRPINQEVVLNTHNVPTISMALNNRMATVFHEVAHALRFQAGEAGFDLIARYQKYQHTGPTYYSRDMGLGYYPGEEFFAECFTLYLVGRKSLKQLSPKGYAMVEDFIDSFGLKGHIRYLDGKDRTLYKAKIIDFKAVQWYKTLRELRDRHFTEPPFLKAPTAGEYRAMLKDVYEFLDKNPEVKQEAWGEALFGNQASIIFEWLEHADDDSYLDQYVADLED